ncbi:MAG: glycosyltransferase family 39 protein [Alphaproteobacteria bacterium]
MSFNRFFLQRFVLVMAFLGILFAFMIGTRPLSAPDEGRYTEIAREMVETGDYVTPRLNGVKYFEKPPLMYWMTSLSLKVWGVNEAAMRFWPAALGFLGCMGLFFVSNHLYGVSAATWSTLALGTNILYYAHTRLLILDMAVSTWISLGLFSFFMAYGEINRLRQRWYLGSFFVMMALAVLTKGLIGAVLPGCVILLWALIIKEVAPIKLAFTPWGVALFFAIAAPWHILAAHRNPEFLHFYFIHEHFERYLTTAHSRYQPIWFFIPIIAVGWMPWSAFLLTPLKDALVQLGRAIKGRAEKGAKNELFFTLWFVCVFLFVSFSKSILIPYILCVFPPMALLVGPFLATSHPRLSLLKRQALALSVTCFLIAVAVPIALFTQDLLSSKELRPFWLGVVLVMALAGSGALILRAYWQGLRVLIVVLSSFLLPLLNASWSLLEGRSIKPLAQMINAQIRPQDHVVSHNRYYQDLPPYIGRRVIVTNWKGELSFGMGVENTSAWMMPQEDFVKLYQKGGRFFIVTRKSSLDYLKDLGINDLKIVGETEQDLLLVGER